MVLRAFTRQTGAAVSYASAGYSVPVFLRARLAAGRLPDVAFLPQPGLLSSYAAEHLLVPLNRIAGRAVASNYNCPGTPASPRPWPLPRCHAWAGQTAPSS